MRITPKGKVKSGRLRFFGPKLLKNASGESSEGMFKLPFEFCFNHSWEFQHNCINCGELTGITEDFELKSRNFEFISDVNSTNFNKSVLQDISKMFTGLYTIEVDGIMYINRSNFTYDLEFQRRSSVTLTRYNCINCDIDYTGLIRIGYPLTPERNNPTGNLGIVEIDEILEMKII